MDKQQFLSYRHLTRFNPTESAARRLFTLSIHKRLHSRRRSFIDRLEHFLYNLIDWAMPMHPVKQIRSEAIEIVFLNPI